MLKAYVAIFERGPDNFGVFFPDFPGCVSVGDDMAEACQNAVIALQSHIETMREFGDVIPEPTPLDRIEDDPEIQIIARALVPVEIDEERIRVNISLSRSKLALLDARASAWGIDRSAAIERLAVTYPDESAGLSENTKPFKNARAKQTRGKKR